MSKILKELIIFILLTIVIVILLIITFYEYIPKIMLSELKQYIRTEKTSAVIQEIRTAEMFDTEKKSSLKSYAINNLYLDAYKDLDIYDESRVDPFSPLVHTAQYETSISGDPSEVIKENKEKENEKTNSTGYFSTSSKTK